MITIRHEQQYCGAIGIAVFEGIAIAIDNCLCRSGTIGIAIDIGKFQ